MHGFIALVQSHPASAALGTYFVFSAFVSGMPSPKPDSSLGYVWAFNSLHALAGNLGRIVLRNGNGVADPAKP